MTRRDGDAVATLIRQDDEPRRSKFDFPPIDKERAFGVLDVLKDVAPTCSASVPQVALAWILANRAVTSVIIGAKTVAQLDDNLKAVDVTLSAEHKAALDEASKLAVEYPAWMDALGSDRRPGEQRF